MKNSADLGGCYPPRCSASVDNALLDLQNSSYPTQPHSVIAKYTLDLHRPTPFFLHYIEERLLLSTIKLISDAESTAAIKQ